MKGLLIKDFKLMKNQKNFFFIMIFIAAAMLFAEFESTFVVSYFTMIASMFVLSTISYDERLCLSVFHAFFQNVLCEGKICILYFSWRRCMAAFGGTVGNSHYYSQSADKRHGLAAD